ncbi:MAG: chromate transporter [Acholeplasmatales bacterium]|jgi:chromate transporter|nr:chromate transporter [Acholeplasmatales bacterium]
MTKLFSLILRLFLVSILTFGGGFAMIPLFNELIVKSGFITSSELYNFIGISEMLPGAFAVDFSVFVGNKQYLILGAILAVIAISLPSFIISLLVVSKGSKIMSKKIVNYLSNYIKPVICGLILGIALLLLFKFVIPITDNDDNFVFNQKIEILPIAIFVFISIIGFVFKKISPIILILISGGLYLLFYCFIIIF